MANLMITTSCNFRCPYCFGLDMIGPEHPKQAMSWEAFLAILDWIDLGAGPELDVHLMGGEPTLHPLFGAMISELARRRRPAAVFSNAAAPIDQDILRSTVDQGVNWIVNCNHPSTYHGAQLTLLHQHLRILSQAATITFNVFSGDADFAYVLENINNFNLKRHVKVGVALPTHGKNNTHAAWDEFPVIADRILQLQESMQQEGITIEFECGVPYCLFSPEQRQQLVGIKISHCGSRLDITPAGDVINCLPLCKIAAIPFSRFSDYRQARLWFAQLQAPYRQVGTTTDCLTCHDRLQQRCFACLAYGLHEFNRVVMPPLPAGPCDA